MLVRPTSPDPALERRGRRLRGATIAGLLAVAAIGLGACSTPAGSSIPSIALPSVTIPTLPPAGSPIAACVDSATFAVFQQLQASGADIPGILTANKTTLVSGLQSFQPADAATMAWRDTLLAAVQAGDAAVVTTQVAALASSQVKLTAC
jgi:hypothetical protein